MATNLKISFLSFYSGIVNRGVETFVHELSNHLTLLGHEITVFQNGANFAGTKYKAVDIGMRLENYTDSKYAAITNSLLVKSFTHKAINMIDPSTQIIFPTNGQWQSFFCKLWANGHGKKLVISGQSGPGLDDRINLWTFPDAFVGLTNHQVAWAKRVNPFTKIAKIPNGVNLTRFYQGIKPLEINLPRPIILCVSALVDWKRIDLAIKAVSRLEQGSLFVVGSGEDKTKLTDLGNKLLPGRFKILSFNHHQMPEVYRAADLFTFPTVPWESFGIVLLEAMASGLPVVASDDPIRREIVGKAGLFVDPTDETAYAKAISTSLDGKWGKIPLYQAVKFSWDKIAHNYQELFKSLIHDEKT